MSALGIGIFINTLVILPEAIASNFFLRDAGLTKNPNTAAFSMAIAAAYLVHLFLKNNSKINIKSIVGGVGFIVLAAGILATSSRVGIFFLGLLPFILIALGNLKAKLTILVIAIVTTITSYRIVEETLKSSFLVVRLEKAEKNKDPREFLIKGGIEMAGDTYLLGYGVGQFYVQFPNYFKNAENYVIQKQLAKKDGLSSHSDFIALLSQHGIFSVISFYAFFVIQLVHRARQVFLRRLNETLKNYYSFMFTVLIGLLLMGGVNENLYSPVWWLLLTIATLKPIVQIESNIKQEKKRDIQ
jgi:hypothetical protein